MSKLLNYFSNDQMAADVWYDKYCMKDKKGVAQEETPSDMHMRMAKEFARIEFSYMEKETKQVIGENRKNFENLSQFGKYLINRRVLVTTTIEQIEQEFFDYFDKFSYIIPQGSIMSNLGNFYIFGSLSNCFGIASPYDSYGGILKTDQELAHLMKRRGGVGIVLDPIRPSGASVSNAAKSSTGVPAFAERYSNTTREVAQEGRRGALMELLICKHPDIFRFVTMKDDRTKVTGANVSVMFTDEFMKAVENIDDTFVCTFPTTTKIFNGEIELFKLTCEYNKIYPLTHERGSMMIIHAKELFNLVAEMAWKNAEPGIAFIDRIVDYCPDGVYELYMPKVCNPCFHPNTLISTVEGQIKIKDITKPIKVYSMDTDGSLCIKQASASFISKKNTKTLKIILRNGNSIEITPEHKLFVCDKGWVEAKDLKINDKIGHLSRSRRGVAYSGVYLTTDPKGRDNQIMEHRLVAGITNGLYDIHHKDRDTYNNKLSNLEVLIHHEHCVITATQDNPQTHQVIDENGKFVIHKNSKKGAKTIIHLPKNLETNIRNQYSSCITTIIEGEITDVYDIQVEDTHCLIANNMVAHNCGEQWFSFDETCRLIALNFFSVVQNHFKNNSAIDYDLLYEISYMQQRLGDNLVDLECEYIDRIINKIKNDPEPEDIKSVELNLWIRIKKKAEEGRRTGGGFTALGDMLAALNLKYDSDEAIATIEKVCKTKMRAELDAVIDMAILRGPFVGWNRWNEFTMKDSKTQLTGYWDLIPKNSFYKMLIEEFPEQAIKLWKYGRRNISWSTVAPTGTVSLMTQTTSGLEPLFKAYYIRRKKINPSEEGSRIDYTDQNGDTWQEYAVLHPKFKEWIKTYLIENMEIVQQEGPLKGYKFEKRDTDSQLLDEMIEYYNKEQIQELFKLSPWYGSEADDISWEKRIEIQAVIQKYTTNAISSTINLPKDIPQEVVKNIYLKAYHSRLKGITVYRDGSRSGVLITETVNKTTTDKFGYNNSIKRPVELEADYYFAISKGKKYAVIVGLLDGLPFEVFAYENPGFEEDTKGKIVKIKRGVYSFISNKLTIQNLQLTSDHEDEKLLTRWVSLLLRHGANPKYIADQVQKSEVHVVSFGKVITRVLKNYIPDEILGEKCDNCNKIGGMIYEEGCKKCKLCGHSKC